MKPLQSVAMGLVIVALSARVLGYDALPDPAGWVLVLLGVRALPAAVPHRTNLRGLGVLALVVSAVLWFPQVPDALYDADPALAWAADLPQLAFSVLLCHALARAAGDADDAKAARTWRVLRTAAIVVGLLPVLVFGGGQASYETTAYLAAGIVAVLLVVLLFAHAGRPWATGTEAGTPGETRTGAAPPEGGTAPEA